MSASVRSFLTAPSARGAGDDFSDARKRAASTKTANTFGSVGDNPAFDEGGDYHDTPGGTRISWSRPSRRGGGASARAARATATPATTHSGRPCRTTW